MNMHVVPEVVERARDVSDLTPEEVACLIEESESAVVIGVFPTGYPEEPWRTHLLRGSYEDMPEHVTVVRFPNSMASFQTKQALRCRAKEMQAKHAAGSACPRCGK
jgi:hypothetical protein